MTMASWPKHSQNTSPGCIVMTPARRLRPGTPPAPGADATAGGATAVGASSAGGTASCASATRGSHAAASASIAASTRRTALFAMHAHVQRMQPARIGARHAEAEAAERQLLAGFRQVPDRRGHEAADGVVLVVVEVGAEALVEIADRRQRIHHVLAVGLGRDQGGDVLGVVVLV